MLSAGDLGIEIDFGRDQPGAIVQKYGHGGWKDYLPQSLQNRLFF